MLGGAHVHWILKVNPSFRQSAGALPLTSLEIKFHRPQRNTHALIFTYFFSFIPFKQLNYECCKGIFYVHRINTYKDSTCKASFQVSILFIQYPVSSQVKKGKENPELHQTISKTMCIYRGSHWQEVGRDLRNACGNLILKLRDMNVKGSASKFVCQ